MRLSKKNIEFGIILILIIAILSFLQFTTQNIIGWDGYWHIKSAKLILEHGFYDTFPWTQYSIIKDNYVDQQLLFRLLLIPFTTIGMMLGAKLYILLASIACFIFFYWLLKRYNTPFAAFWTLLYLLGSNELLYRFMLPRQMPLAIIALLLTCYLLEKKSYNKLFFTVLLFTYLYNGFVFSLIICIIYTFVDLIANKRFNLTPILYSFPASLIAFIINPYFPDTFLAFKTQIWDVNLVGNLYNQEWRPFPIDMFLYNTFLILIIFAIIFCIYLFIKSSQLKNTHLNQLIKKNKINIFYMILTIFFLLLALKSRRMIEYLYPFMILTSAKIFSYLFENKKNQKILKIGVIIATIVLIPMALLNIREVRSDILLNNFQDNYRDAALWMKENIPPRSIVFNNAYTFNYLFFMDSDIYYTHGIDLTYSYLYDKVKFVRYMKILEGEASTEENFVMQDYNPDYVFISKLKVDLNFFRYMQERGDDFDVVYQDKHAVILKVKR